MILPFCLINHFNHVHRFWRSVFDHRNLVRLSFGIHHPGFWASKLVSSALNLLVGYQNKTLFRKLQTGWYQSKYSMHWFCEHKTSGWLVYLRQKRFSCNVFPEPVLGSMWAISTSIVVYRTSRTKFRLPAPFFWRFPKVGVPLNHPFIDGISNKSSSYWGPP